MIKIRDYKETDSQAVGQLIAYTYGHYNLDFVSPEERGPYLGPFRHAGSPEDEHRQAIAGVIRASMVFVAENQAGEIVGVLRGRKDRLQSLFVRGDHHRQGIGRALVEHFERRCIELDGQVIRLFATLYAVPFYQSMGYKKSTGVRKGWSFQGEGLLWQPMKKVLK